MKPDELITRASTVSALPAGEVEGDDALHSLTELSLSLVAGCDAASLSIAGSDRTATRAATDTLAETLDRIQYRLDEGPCLDAIRTGAMTVPAPGMAAARWPRFWEESRAEGLARTLSAPLRVEQRTIGSLNLYSRSDELGSSERDLFFGALLASYASMALAAEDAAAGHRVLVDQLNQALASRDMIGQAKGILMAREGCNADQAFDMLRRASQRLNQKLRDVAEQIVESAASKAPHRRL